MGRKFNLCGALAHDPKRDIRCNLRKVLNELVLHYCVSFGMLAVCRIGIGTFCADFRTSKVKAVQYRKRGTVHESIGKAAAGCSSGVFTIRLSNDARNTGGPSGTHAAKPGVERHGLVRLPPSVRF